MRYTETEQAWARIGYEAFAQSTVTNRPFLRMLSWENVGEITRESWMAAVRAIRASMEPK